MYKFAIGEIVKVTTDLEHIYDMPNAMKEHAGAIAKIFHREMDGDRNVYQLSLPGVDHMYWYEDEINRLVLNKGRQM